MAEIVSALAGHVKPGRHGLAGGSPGVVLGELKGRDLTQVGAWSATVGEVGAYLAAELGFAMPSDTRRATSKGDVTVFMVAPDKWWIVAPYTHFWHKRIAKELPADKGVATELGHSRSIVTVTGPNARDLLARNIAVDLDPDRFGPGSFASSGIHGVGVLVHYAADHGAYPVFHAYLPRTFALSLFEGMVHLAEQWGVDVEV
jgi:sarcosine oxidase subunit gamma